MKKFKSAVAAMAVLAMATLTACTSIQATPSKSEDKTDSSIETEVLGNDMRVSYIDVGQADAQFIELPNGKTMLIDAGTNETGKTVVDYIQSLGYTTIDYLIATHPHEDHIGGLDDVINNFDIVDLYMPKITADTKTFEDVLNAIDAKKLIVYTAHAGVTLVNKDNLSVNMVAPVSDSYDDLNNYSAVVKVVYGDTSFLFTGDAEELSEKEITADVSADVLKVGHHGSTSSTSDYFLNKVNPKIAVISCGAGNKYGHPNQEILDRLNAKGVTVLRTDELGTIVLKSNGTEITDEKATVTVDNSTNATPATGDAATIANSNVSSEITYVLNTNSKKLHYSDCSSVAKMSDANKAYTTDFTKAIADGYEPCGECKPQ